MVSFAKLGADLEIKGRTAEFTLAESRQDPRPVLIVKSAGTDNRAFLNALLAETGQDIRAMKGRLSAEKLDRARAATRKLYPQHIIVGWKNVRDDTGNPVVFSPAAADSLVSVLPDYALDALSSFCNEPSNFLAPGQTQPITGDVIEDVAGN